MVPWVRAALAAESVDQPDTEMSVESESEMEMIAIEECQVTSSERGELLIEQRVSVVFDDVPYPGTVTGYNEQLDVYSVSFDNGDVEDDVKYDEIKFL